MGGQTRTGELSICRHVGDILCFADDPLAQKYSLRDVNEPDEHLGCTIRTRDGKIHLDGSKYIKEAVRRIGRLLKITLRKNPTPLPNDDHPEEDETSLLDDNGIRNYQMLIGMAQWLVVLCRIDIAFAVSSLSHFSSVPREGHYARATRLWGYLKKFKNKGIMIDSNSPQYNGTDKLVAKSSDFTEQYSAATEEIPPGIPEPPGGPLEVTAMFDSDHGHDTLTRRSMTGQITFLGCTPVMGMSKSQGAVATSTYGAEFSAMRTATEETISIRYMLRLLGIPVRDPFNVLGDNLGVMQNALYPESVLKKKHVALSFHFVRELVNPRILLPHHCPGADNH